MRPVDRPATADRPKLPAAARIALEALTWLVADTDGPVHIEDWRAEAYKRGISESTEARRKAFSRARTVLLNAELIVCNDDFYTPRDTGTERDKTGHVPPMSPCVPGQDGTPPYKGCPMSRQGTAKTPARIIEAF